MVTDDKKHPWNMYQIPKTTPAKDSQPKCRESITGQVTEVNLKKRPKLVGCHTD
jgi:hypothetical protein